MPDMSLSSLIAASQTLTSMLKEMASSPESMQHRVGVAYNRYLATLNPESDLPAELHGEYQGIVKSLTKIKDVENGEDDVAVTLAQMSTEEAVEIAKKLVHIFSKVTRERMTAEVRDAMRVNSQS